jgi:hypothetical protein
VQATAHGSAGNFRAMADLGDGQVPLALLERLHHGQATGQEVMKSGSPVSAWIRLAGEATIGGATEAKELRI